MRQKYKEVTMIRVVVVLVAVLLTASLVAVGVTAQMKIDPPKAEQTGATEPTSDKMGQRVEGTIKTVSGNMVTLEDGTQLSIPSSVKVVQSQLKPGVQISADYEEQSGQKVATSVRIKG